MFVESWRDITSRSRDDLSQNCDRSLDTGCASMVGEALIELSSYRDWYRDGPFGTVPQQHRTVAAGPMQVINVSPPAGPIVEPPVPEYALHLLLKTAPLLRVGFNRPPRWLAVGPGSMLIAPPDCSCEYAAEAAAHVLTVVIPSTVAEDFARDVGARLEIRDETAFRNPALAQQIVRLWIDVADDATATSLLADRLTRNVLDAIARAGGTSVRRDGRERLANHVLRRIRDYVESGLADDLNVPAMAEVADLSPAHFARAFTATVRMTPFRYVMSRRLARARELLERTDRTALDIALDVGFKTPSHFTSLFRREYGVTPRAIRADTRNTFLEPRSR
jgi:AraC family transcriptional regulator